MVRKGNEGNPYFKAFFEMNGINVGDEFKGYEYQSWIQEKHNEYRDYMGMPREIGLDKENEERFIRFLYAGTDAISDKERKKSIAHYKMVNDLIDSLSGETRKRR